MDRSESVGYCCSDDSVDAWEGSIEDDHNGCVASLGCQGVVTKEGEEGK